MSQITLHRSTDRQLCELDAACFAEGGSLAQWQKYLQQPKRYFARAILENERPLGFLIYALLFDEAELLRIGLLPEARGRGLALQALQRAESHFIDLGLGRILLEVRRSNKAAIRVYERDGFSVDGVRKGYYPACADGPAEDALLMSKQLA